MYVVYHYSIPVFLYILQTNDADIIFLVSSSLEVGVVDYMISN